MSNDIVSGYAGSSIESAGPIAVRSGMNAGKTSETNAWVSRVIDWPICLRKARRSAAGRSPARDAG